MDHNGFVQIDLIFQRKLSRRRFPITFFNFVSHASAQARKRYDRSRLRNVIGQLGIHSRQKIKENFFPTEVNRSAPNESGT